MTNAVKNFFSYAYMAGPVLWSGHLCDVPGQIFIGL